MKTSQNILLSILMLMTNIILVILVFVFFHYSYQYGIDPFSFQIASWHKAIMMPIVGFFILLYGIIFCIISSFIFIDFLIRSRRLFILKCKNFNCDGFWWTLFIFEIINVTVIVLFVAFYITSIPKYEEFSKRRQAVVDKNIEELSQKSINNKIKAEGLYKFKCEVFVKNNYEENLTLAQNAVKNGDIDIAIQHLKWALEKLRIQGDFLKEIEVPSDEWKETIDIITKNYIDGSIKGINSDLIVIDNFEIGEQKKAIMVLVSNLQTNKENIINYFSNISCE